MDRPFFTVVMPAYGVEKYLKKAVDSIRSQTFEDWELIIVEDGSPDRTGELADELAGKDPRIRAVHHEKNKGLSQARNTGIRHAKGKYIWFMDPDDSVEESLLQDVWKAQQENPARLTVFGHVEEYYEKDGSFSYAHPVKPHGRLCRNRDQVREEILPLEQETLYGYAWNKIYDLDYIRDKKLKYETVRLIEDIVFNIQYCMDIDTMNLLAITPYHYAKRMEGSLTTKFVPDYYPLHRRRISMLYEQQKYWGKDTRETCSVLGSLYGRYILSALERNCDKRAKMGHKDRKEFCRDVFADPLFQKLLPAAEARDSRALKLALACMKARSVFLCLAFCRAVHLVRGSLPMLYSKVKSER